MHQYLTTVVDRVARCLRRLAWIIAGYLDIWIIRLTPGYLDNRIIGYLNSNTTDNLDNWIFG